MSRKPNLFVVGAMKSGTTFLTAMLRQHPAIYVPKMKEPDYFVDEVDLLLPEARISAAYGTQKRLTSYLSLFESARDEVYLVDASTAYSKIPAHGDVPQRIAEFNPDARIIYIMRDPVERSISHYCHAVHIMGETRPILEAVRNCPDYMNVSDYAMQIEPYLKAFGRDRVYTATFEQLTENPETRVREIWQWLGIDPDGPLRGVTQKRHETPQFIYQDRKHLSLRPLMMLNRRTLNSWHLEQMIKKVNKTIPIGKKKIDIAAMETVEAENFLRPKLQERIAKLEILLGRGFPEWRILYSDRGSDSAHEAGPQRLGLASAQAAAEGRDKPLRQSS